MSQLLRILVLFFLEELNTGAACFDILFVIIISIFLA